MLIRYLTAALLPFRFEEAGASTGAGASGTTPAATQASTTTTTAPSASSTTPASTPGSTTPAAASTTASDDDIQQGNWKELRTRYESARTKAQVLDSLGIDAAELPDVTKAFTAIRTEAQTLAREVMGTDYDDADFKAAFAKDPAQLLHILRTEKAAASRQAPTPSTTPRPGETPADTAARIKEEVERQTKPYTEHINRQISEQVVTKIGTETHTALAATALKDAPAEVRDLVMDYVSDYFSSPAQSNLIVAMKARGDFSSVGETVKLVAGRLQTAFSKWTAAEAARVGAGSRQSSSRTSSPVAPTSSKSGRPTLDQIINDPGVLGADYA